MPSRKGWNSGLFENFDQFPITDPDPDSGEPNQCGSGPTTLQNTKIPEDPTQRKANFTRKVKKVNSNQ